MHEAADRGRLIGVRVEQPDLVVHARVAHPLDPRAGYRVGPLRIHAWRGVPTGPSDPLFGSTPEMERAYLNTIDYVEARGL